MDKLSDHHPRNQTKSEEIQGYPEGYNVTSCLTGVLEQRERMTVPKLTDLVWENRTSTVRKLSTWYGLHVHLI